MHYYVKLRNDPGIKGERGDPGEKGISGSDGVCEINTSCDAIQNCRGLIKKRLMEKMPEYKAVIEKRDTELQTLNENDKNIINQVYKLAKNKKKILVLLDSKHTEKHVLKELDAYSKLVKKGSYIVVFDTIIEDTNSKKAIENRPWGVGNNPKTAVWKFLKKNNRFKIDKFIEKKILLTSCPDGYLKCIK